MGQRITARPSKAGENAGSIFVYLERKDAEAVVVSAKVLGLEAFHITPMQLQLGNVLRGQSIEKELTVATQIGGWELDRVAYDEERFKVRSSLAGAEPTRRLKIAVNVKPDAPLGAIRGHVALYFKGEKKQIGLVAIGGEICLPVGFTPDSLKFQLGKKGTRVVVVRSYDGRPVELSSADLSASSLQLTLPKTAATRHLVRISYDGGDLPLKSFEIQTTHPEIKSIKIPIDVTSTK